MESHEIQLLLQRGKEGDAALKHYTVKDDKLLYKNRLVIPSSSPFIATILRECHDELKGVTQAFLRQ